MKTANRIPRAPAHLSKEAANWWKKILTEYELPEESLLILESALESFDRMRQAQEEIKTRGLIVKTLGKFGESIRQNPAVGIETESKRTMLACFRQLGLDLEPLNPTPGRPAGK